MIDRQSIRLACTSSPMAAAFAIAAIVTWVSMEASAQGLQIGVASSSTIAPAHLTLTASASPGADPLVAYDWKSLEFAPRCRTERCAIDFAVAACRFVELEATTSLGEVLTATRTVCVGDARGRPPIASFKIDDPGAGFPLGAVAHAVPTTDRIAIVRRWLDDKELSADTVEIPKDGACHALDLLVADRKGRIGIDHRTLCTRSDAPILWIGASPGPFAPSTSAQQLCSEGVDPRGGALVETAGTVPLNGCAAPMPAPAGVSRQVVRARSGGDPESTASILLATAPSTDPRTLLFARLPDMVFGIQGIELSAVLEIFGGAPPYRVTVSLTKTNGGAVVAGTADPVNAMGDTTVRIARPESGSHRLDVTVTDGRGMEATASAGVTVRLPSGGADGGPGGGNPDAGSGGGHPTSSGAHGCGGTLVVPSGPLRGSVPFAEIALAAAALVLLRRKDRR
jgi:hypothetical protein